MIVKRINPFSAAKVAAAIYGAIGLLAGAIVAVISQLSGGMLGISVGLGAVIIWPILYAIAGFVVTVVGAWVYNLAAGAVGGVQIEVE